MPAGRTAPGTENPYRRYIADDARLGEKVTGLVARGSTGDTAAEIEMATCSVVWWGRSRFRNGRVPLQPFPPARTRRWSISFVVQQVGWASRVVLPEGLGANPGPGPAGPSVDCNAGEQGSNWQQRGEAGCPPSLGPSASLRRLLAAPPGFLFLTCAAYGSTRTPLLEPSCYYYPPRVLAFSDVTFAPRALESVTGHRPRPRAVHAPPGGG